MIGVKDRMLGTARGVGGSRPAPQAQERMRVRICASSARRSDLRPGGAAVGLVIRGILIELGGVSSWRLACESVSNRR